MSGKVLTAHEVIILCHLFGALGGFYHGKNGADKIGGNLMDVSLGEANGVMRFSSDFDQIGRT